MHKINLFGASGHAKVIMDIAKANALEIAHIFDDNEKLEHILSKKIIHQYDKKLLQSHPIIISIGDNKTRKRIYEHLDLKISKALIHPTAVVSDHVKIGKGTVVMPNVVINSGTVIGENCIINSGAVIEHDCRIEDYAHISPKSALAGGVTIGQGTHIGIGSVVIQGIHVGEWSTIGAGAVVTKDIPAHCTAVGIPAKPIKFH